MATFKEALKTIGDAVVDFSQLNVRASSKPGLYRQFLSFGCPSGLAKATAAISICASLSAFGADLVLSYLSALRNPEEMK